MTEHWQEISNSRSLVRVLTRRDLPVIMPSNGKSSRSYPILFTQTEMLGHSTGADNGLVTLLTSVILTNGESVA